MVRPDEEEPELPDIPLHSSSSAESEHFGTLFSQLRYTSKSSRPWTYWYERFLLAKIRGMSPDLTDPLQPFEDADLPGRVSDLLALIAEVLSDHEDPALGYILQEATKRKIIRGPPDQACPGPSDQACPVPSGQAGMVPSDQACRTSSSQVSRGSSDQVSRVPSAQASRGPSEQACQLIFVCFGLLTFLYAPSLSPSPGFLEITYPRSFSQLETLRLPLRSDKKKDSVVHMSMTDIVRELGIHGDLSPSFQMSAAGHCGGQSPTAPFRRVSDLTFSWSNVCYYTLSEVCGIQLVETETATRHLQLDARSKSLFLFRYPSFCAMVRQSSFRSRNEATEQSLPLEYSFLDRFFRNFFGRDDSIGDENVEAVDALFPKGLSTKLHKEILLSYRIIFGQEKSSWKAFRRRHKSQEKARRSADLALGREGGFRFDVLKSWWRALCGSQGQPARCGTSDPLFDELRCKDWRETNVVLQVGADPVKVAYQASEFPFLGARLMELNDFVVAQSPTDWRGLWNDKRNIERYWTFWAVIWFGGLSLCLGLVQIAVGAGQMYYAKKQASQDGGTVF